MTPVYEMSALRAELSQWLGSTSFSLLRAQGVALTPEREKLADLEEETARCAQRWLQALKESGEEAWLVF